ncbi:hypothetical protein KR018_001627, partial [Drosophila ironensis]
YKMLVERLLWLVNLYAQCIGLSNFECDWKTGRAIKTHKCTLKAIAANIFVVALLITYYSLRTNLAVAFVNASKLHEYVVIVISGLRIIAGLVTILNRWRQRRQIMNLFSCVARLYLAKPQVKTMTRWGILMKLISALATDLCQLLLTFNSLDYVGYVQILGMAVQFLMCTIINIAMSQHFVIVLIIRGNYRLMNMELRQVIEECKTLSYRPPRVGVFMTKCCVLADRLEAIARFQSTLQAIIHKLQEVFGIQGLMVYTGYYISSIGINYFLYTTFKGGNLNVIAGHTSLVLAFIWVLLYYMDALINLFVILQTQDDHQELERLLHQRTLFAPGLDVRLEETFENIQIQLIRNPLKMCVLQLFPTNRSSTAAMLGSLLLNSIFLIQYDMENF